MIIFDEYKRTVLLRDIKAPIINEYCWCLDLEMMDFCITKLTIMSEITGPALQLNVGNFSFWIPAKWYVLIYDLENSIVDIAKASELPAANFLAVTYGFTETMITPSELTVIGYEPEMSIVTPFLHSHQMVCHAVSPTKWVVISPNDVYNKFLKNITIGDLY